MKQMDRRIKSILSLSISSTMVLSNDQISPTTPLPQQQEQDTTTQEIQLLLL